MPAINWGGYSEVFRGTGDGKSKMSLPTFSQAWQGSFTKEPKYKLPHWVPKDNGILQTPKPRASLRDTLEKPRTFNHGTTKSRREPFISTEKPLDCKHHESRICLVFHLLIPQTSTPPGTRGCGRTV